MNKFFSGKSDYKIFLKPLVIFLIGMAGSGKTTLVCRLSSDLSYLKKNHYIINIDPACLHVPYSANIDIRDTIDYKKIMKEYNLGPNGAIVVALNLFSTRFDQIKRIIMQNATSIEYLILDTPGQIEIFTWSASGSIICETFSSSFPVILLYTIDIIRISSPLVFVGNILYSCSILYKSRLPVVMLVNKNDIISGDFIKEWMNDSDAFDKVLEREKTFINSFASSLSLTLENFYNKIPFLKISSLNGIGVYQMLNVLKKIQLEFSTFYQNQLEKHIVRYIEDFNFSHVKKFQGTRNFTEKKNYLDTIEFMIFSKIENDKIYSVKIS
nr:ATP/GTP-bp [Cryptomonas paramecium]